MASTKSWEEIRKAASAEKFELKLPENGDEPTELVVLFGWFGARMRTLNKYSVACRELLPGAATLSLISSAIVKNPLRVRQYDVARAVLKILNLISGKVPNIKTWFYNFSNGGIVVHTALVKLMDGNKDKLSFNLRGIIMDSCPAFLTSTSVSRAFNNGKDSLLLYGLSSIAMSIGTLSRVTVNFWKECTEFDLGVPELYLYSEGDHVTIYDKLVELIETRKTNGMNITTYDFKDSGHCSHLREHPDEYMNVLQSFFAK